MRPGRQDRSLRSKTSRNSLVVEYTAGLPGAFFRPDIFMSLLSMSVESTPPESTPRMASISPRVMGWR